MSEGLIDRDTMFGTARDSGRYEGLDDYKRKMAQDEETTKAATEAARAQTAADLEELNEPGDDGRYPGEPLPQPPTWREVVGDEAVDYGELFRD